MNRWGPRQLLSTIAVSLVLWSACALLGLCVGSTGAWGWPSDHFVFLYRLEVVLIASLVGAALASAGVVYQAILRNPLADPYLLGVSSGAMLASFAWRFNVVMALASVAGAAGQQAFAFAGALAAAMLVFLLTNRRGRIEPVRLILVGVIVNAFNGSLFLLLNALHEEVAAKVGGLLGFLVGGIQSNLTRQQEVLAAACVGLGWMAMLFVSGDLNVAMLGEAEAQSLGVRINRLRWIALGLASVVTASAVAISGPIGFVGLVCPHLARLLVGADTRRLLPVSTALGAALLVLADAASRTLAHEGRVQTLLPVGVLTGLLGGPFFLFLLWQNREGDRAAG